MRSVSGNSKPPPTSTLPLGFHFTPTTPVTTLVPATPPAGRLMRSSPAIAVGEVGSPALLHPVKPVDANKRIPVVDDFVVPLVRPVPELRAPVAVGGNAESGAAEPVAAVEDLLAAGEKEMEVAVAEVGERAARDPGMKYVMPPETSNWRSTSRMKLYLSPTGADRNPSGRRRPPG